MATANKTWQFANITEYNAWTHTTTAGTQTRSYDSTNQRAQIQSETGRNKTSDGHLSFTDTFANIFGISTSATITGYSAASFNGGCSAFAFVDIAQHGDPAGLGSFEVNDGTSRVLINSQTTYTASGQTRNPTISNTVSGLSLSATTAVTIYVHDNFANQNDGAAGATIWVDNISLSIEYNAPSAGRNYAFVGTITGAGAGAVSFLD